MIFSTNNNQLTVYSTRVDNEELIHIQNELVREYGSNERIKKTRQHEDAIRNLLKEQHGEKKVTISKKECDSVEVWYGAHSSFEPLYDFEYEVIKLPPLGIIIERVLKGDLSAISKIMSIITSKQEKSDYAKNIATKILDGDLPVISELKPETISEQDILQYAKRIAACINLNPVYCNEVKHYSEFLAIISQTDKESTTTAIQHFRKMAETGNQIVDTITSLTIAENQMKKVLIK